MELVSGPPASNVVPAMADPVVKLTDTFGRPDAAVPGNGWVDVQGGVAAIVNRQLVITGDAVDTSQYKRDFVLRPQAEDVRDGVWVFHLPPNNTTGNTIDFCMRYSRSTAQTCYFVDWEPQNTAFNIYKLVSGTATGLLTYATLGAFTAGHTYRVEASVMGASPTTISITVWDETANVLFGSASIEDSTAGLQGVGGAGFLTHFSANGNTPPKYFVSDFAAESVSKPIVIGAIGDSITAGTGLASAATDALPIQLGVALQRLLPMRNVVVSNQGVSGDQSSTWAAGGTRMNAAEAAWDALEVPPWIFTVMLGTNDADIQNAVSKATYKANIQNIITELAAHYPGCCVVMHSPPYVSANADNGTNTYTSATQHTIVDLYVPALQELAAANPGVAFVGDVTAFEKMRPFAGNLYQNQVTAGSVRYSLHPDKTGAAVLAGLQALALYNALGSKLN